MVSSFLAAPEVHVIRPLLDADEKLKFDELQLNNRMRFRVEDLEPYAPALLMEKVTPKPIYIRYL